MDADRFIDFVKESFSFLMTEVKMKPEKETVNGNAFYSISYRDQGKEISISLETIENYFQVILFELNEGEMPDYDDKTRTIHLNKMNYEILKIIPEQEFTKNNQFFREIKPEDEIERVILKSAKELRLCLKHY